MALGIDVGIRRGASQHTRADGERRNCRGSRCVWDSRGEEEKASFLCFFLYPAFGNTTFPSKGEKMCSFQAFKPWWEN